MASSHSQNRMTIHPRLRRSLTARRSRALFFRIFCRHSFAFFTGVRFLPQSWPCQKHPSTNTATLAWGHAKSGLPGTFWCLRHPLSPAARRSEAMRSSVVSFPLLRTRDMSCPRVRPPKLVRSFCALPGHAFIFELPALSSLDCVWPAGFGCLPVLHTRVEQHFQ